MKLKLLILLLISGYSFSQIKKPDSLQLFFDNAKHTITDSHKVQLQNFFKDIKLDEVLQIRIKGYTDFIGNHVYNNKLSKKRAKATYIFVTNNYQFKAIAQQGLGELDEEIAEATIEGGNSKHRKVDLILSYEKPKEVYVSLTRKQRYLSQLPKLTVGEKLRIQHTNFHISTATITNSSKEDIEGIIKILKAYPKLKVLIEGHVCCGGKEEYESKIINPDNLALSTERAKNIYNTLIKKGIKANRLSYKGYGFTRPLDFPENTIAIQRENRRIELKVLKK
ncbi:MAG: OmpA family protein [Flavobacteriaceae bacterium]|nr:OmpA family protein [Flavobacteriaceae bacterium]